MKRTALAANRGLLRGVTVIEWGEFVAVPLCGRILADMGARVIKVEPPHGDVARSMPPFFPGVRGPESSAFYQHLNLSKESLCLDVKTRHGRRDIHRLLEAAHLLIEGQRPADARAWGFDHPSLAKRHAHLGVVSVTPFGKTGPYRDLPANDLTIWAMSSQATANPRFVPEPDMAPLKLPGYAASEVAGRFAAAAAAAALMSSKAGAAGVHFDLSMLDCLIATAHTRLARYQVEGRSAPRVGPPVAPRFAPAGIFRCKDGYVAIVCNLDSQWQGLVRAMGNPDWASIPEFSTSLIRAQHIPELTDLMQPWLDERTKQQIFERCQRERVPASPTATMRDVAESPQFSYRKAWVEAKAPAFGKQLALRPPYLADGLSWTPKLAPTLKRNGRSFLGALHSLPMRPRIAKSGLPLAGFRIVELGAAIASPYCTLLCADLGAEVIKIETSRRPDIMRLIVTPDPAPNPLDGGMVFNSINGNKQGILLDIATPKGREKLLDLVATADAVVENFAVGTLERLGLGHRHLRTRRPDLVMLSLTGFGMTGPYKDCVAYGNISEAMAGLVNLHGYVGGPPVETPFPYNDCLSAIHGASLLIAALLRRRETGLGLHIDFAESELTLHLMHQAFFDWLLNKRDRTRQTNRDDAYPVHGIFRSKGDDAWVATAARSDDEWRGLCKAMTRDDWLRDQRFATHEGRIAHQDELEKQVAEWALAFTPQEAAHRLQQHGVPAAPAYHIEQLLADSHVASRGTLMRDTHRYTSGRILASPPLRASDLPVQHRLPAPCLGEHNNDIFGRLLGIGDGEIDRLRKEQIFS